MTVIIAGSRSITDRDIVESAINACSAFHATKILSGGAPGVDTQGELWAKRKGIPFDRIRPTYGRGVSPKIAPKLRNWAMAIEADALIAVWDGFSGGTAHMIALMVALGKPVYVEKPPAPDAGAEERKESNG